MSPKKGCLSQVLWHFWYFREAVNDEEREREREREKERERE